MARSLAERFDIEHSMSNNDAMSLSPLISPRVLLRSEDTDGAVGVVRNDVAGYWGGPPLHHHDFDEAFHVLTGQLTFQLGEEVFTAGAGQHVFVPRGAVHTLANLAGAPASYLLTITPGGFERYFDPLAGDDYPETIVVGPQIAAPVH
jgi:quercetin dioxygenase-like cupin family protein